MTEPKEEMPIWFTTLDGIYQIVVMRIDDYHGRLSVSREGEELFSKEVTLAFAAQFGPDVDDVLSWQEWAIQKVDSQ